MRNQQTRRDFLKTSTAVGVAYWVSGNNTPAFSNSANEEVRIASIGVGGKGSSDTDQAGNHGRLVAICDIDDNKLNAKAESLSKTEKHKGFQKFNDFRKMLDEIGKSIDAVTVSTPDHTHAVASIMAMNMGKHVYCQKPLTHSVFEARMMREVAKKNKVATQMGNQGTAENGLRRAVEIIQDGVIGNVKEIHVWTNRPVWDQAPDMVARPTDTPACPAHVHWDLFLGPAPERAYSPKYHPFAWRGWLDFGTGALGDMACHTANMAFMACKLGYPTSVVAEATDVNSETFPSSAKITFDFPARGELPPLKFYWYEGRQGGRHNKEGKQVLPPEELLSKVLKPGQKLSDSGSLLVGDKGILFSPNDYGAQYVLLPEEQYIGYKGPAETLPRNGKGDDGMKAEWVAAIKGGPAAMSNFDYAGLLTESILLGNVAVRAGKKIEWDGPNMKVTNCPEAAQYIKREYRKGWELTGLV
ncbi:MAG: Gfo/Idh/MocA family oxidoreductase [Planctomycetota bacterium]